MAWQYEIANGDPLNKFWFAFVELAQGLRERIILTDGSDTGAPEYTVADGSTKRNVTMADFVGMPLRSASVHRANIQAWRNGLTTIDPDRNTSIVSMSGAWYKDNTFTSVRTVANALSDGSYGSSWVSDDPYHPDLIAQMQEVLSSFRYARYRITHSKIELSCKTYRNNPEFNAKWYGVSHSPMLEEGWDVAYGYFTSSFSTSTDTCDHNTSIKIGAGMSRTYGHEEFEGVLPVPTCYRRYISSGSQDQVYEIDYTLPFEEAFERASLGTILGSIFRLNVVGAYAPEEAVIPPEISGTLVCGHGSWAVDSYVDTTYTVDLDGDEIAPGKIGFTDTLPRELDVPALPTDEGYYTSYPLPGFTQYPTMNLGAEIAAYIGNCDYHIDFGSALDYI